VNNLVDEYFKRDLTEAEEQQLASWLASSPEDSQRLAQGLADMYAKSGLPQPVWPGGTLPFQKSKWLLLRPLAPLLLILALIGTAGYKWLANLPVSTSIQLPVVTPLAHSLEKMPLKKIHNLSNSVEPALKQISKPTAHSLSEGAPPQVQLPITPPTDNLTLPQSPSNPAVSTAPAPQGHVYQQMSVVLDQAAAGLVTVKVVDNLNTDVRTLYAGILPEGKRTFKWDGKTDVGAVAPAGTYYIEVKSGQNVMKQKVNVEGDGTP
jgi:hypothetical protein